ncbi:MAG: 23S rRNA (adenine(2503)-C(2))-methyltransferase RlmN, partial [Verrucomicrobia bacterium]|nr:23S rRNA (adenine(2503)-C(2))-methyltransferase RlmN [Verrucomicrobiota bacterium]
WLYLHRVTVWEAMTNLPKPLREQLRQNFTLQTLELVRKQRSRARPVRYAAHSQAEERPQVSHGASESADFPALTSGATQKFLWRLTDHALIESVLIPANPALYGDASDRHTLCVSTQVGCAYGCKFCASGLDGWKRNLAPHEIVEQVLAVERWHESSSSSSSSSSNSDAEAITTTRTTEKSVNNIVVMGMGEPLANYDNLLKALRILNAPWGGGIGARKITISTSGLVPQIRKLADEPEQFRLAISLHGATDETRNKIMPVNRKFPLKELTTALEYYQSKRGRLITFEYILIQGVNNSLDQIKPLAALARRLNAKVNLIPYNKVEGLPWERPAEATCEAFLAALEKNKVAATLRREKGQEIDAACGQLRLKTERKLIRR